MVAELNTKQNKALEFFEANLDEWVKNPRYKHKFAVIRENAMIGVFDTFGEAVADAAAKYPEIDFIVQEVISPDEIVHFHFPELL